MSIDYTSVAGYGFEMTEEIARSLGKPEVDEDGDEISIDQWLDDNAENLPNFRYDTAGDSYCDNESIYICICNIANKTLDADLISKIEVATNNWTKLFEEKGIEVPKFRFYNELWIY